MKRRFILWTMLLLSTTSFGQYRKYFENEVLLGMRFDLPLLQGMTGPPVPAEGASMAFEAGYRYKNFATSLGYEIFDASAYIAEEIWLMPMVNDHDFNVAFIGKCGYAFRPEIQDWTQGQHVYWTAGFEIGMGKHRSYRVGLGLGRYEGGEYNWLRAKMFLATTWPFDKLKW